MTTEIRDRESLLAALREEKEKIEAEITALTSMPPLEYKVGDIICVRAQVAIIRDIDRRPYCLQPPHAHTTDPKSSDYLTYSSWWVHPDAIVGQLGVDA